MTAPDRATAAVGSTHASTVIPVVSLSGAPSATVTLVLAPSTTSALPYRPAVVHVAPLSVPVLPFPDASATVVPLPSSNEYAATSPAGVAGVVALATFEYALGFPAASVARTR